MENSTHMMNITGPFSYRGKYSITDFAEQNSQNSLNRIKFESTDQTYTRKLQQYL